MGQRLSTATQDTVREIVGDDSIMKPLFDLAATASEPFVDEGLRAVAASTDRIASAIAMAFACQTVALGTVYFFTSCPPNPPRAQQQGPLPAQQVVGGDNDNNAVGGDNDNNAVGGDNNNNAVVDP